MSSPEKPIGYKNPPKAHRIKPGEIRNPRGRPKKAPTGGGMVFDISKQLEALSAHLLPPTAKGMHPLEIELHKHFQSALKGKLRSIQYMFDIFAKYEAVVPPKKECRGGVLILPDDATLPKHFSEMLAYEFGLPPWTAAQIAKLTPRFEQYLKENVVYRKRLEAMHGKLTFKYE